MGNFSSVQDQYVPAKAKALRDCARTIPHHDPLRKQLFQQAAQVIFEHNNDERMPSRHEFDLHGLYREEVIKYIELELRREKEQLRSRLVFIMGRGLQLTYNIGVFRQAIVNVFGNDWKSNLSYDYEIGFLNEGRISVAFIHDESN